MGTATGARVAAQGWGFQYPGRSAPALSDVSFTIEPGALVVLMGASGSGKSTLLAALAGTLPQGRASGELRVQGSDGRSARIGVVRQEPEGNIVMERVGDDVAFPLENAAVPAGRIWARVSGALASVGLRVPLDRATSRLSGGQQQLLAVAASAVAGPDLLLLDEPTANLDPGAAADVLAAVEQVRAVRGCTVIIVEHRVEAWLERADAILLADAGVLIGLNRAELGAHLAQRPDAASRLWIDHDHLPLRPPAGRPGGIALTAAGVAVAGRLPATDLDLRTGEVVAVTGPPGSGKSSLLACLAGLLTPTAGVVRVRSSAPAGRAGPGDGPAEAQRADPWEWSSREVARRFGVVFQNPEHQFVTGGAFEEVHHGLAGAGVGEPEASERSTVMLEQLHLSHLASADPFTLSGGEQRRLSVGTALALDPGILVLDEPTFGQDPVTWAELVGIIADHRDAGGSVVMATHDPDLVRALAAREVRLDPAPPPSPPEPPAVPPPATGLRRLDPLALMGSAMLLSTAALVSASVTLNLGLALLSILAALVGGLAPRRVALLSAPAILAAASVAFSNALLSGDGLTSASSWAAAALPASRVLAVALPGLVAAIALDPTQLADALVDRLHVPARPAYSVLAGLRLLPLLADEWEVLGRASRARGLGGSGFRSRIGQFGSMTFRLLVAALRRGGQLAIALDARGLRPATPRTIARPSCWSWWDPIAVLVALVGLVAALWTRLG